MGAQETAAADAAADPTLNGVAAATPTGANSGYSRAVIAATTAPVDPAGVAVVAYQIDVGDSNPELKVLTDAMTATNTNAGGIAADSAVFYTTADTAAASTVLTPATTANVNMSTLMMLDDGALEDYYFYDGSLTAPADVATNTAHSCAEIVRWIIPTQRLTMTAAEMAAFNLNANWGATAFGDRNSRTTQTGDRITGIT